MANIHLKTSSNGGNINFKDPTMPKYVGARAKVTRTEEGVTIWMSDYKGTTTETIAEAIADIVTNNDGSLTFVLPDEREITTGSLKGPAGADGQDGQDGQDGADGVGIASIEKTGTSGLVDTYTITYTDGDTDTFDVTNGANGVVDVEVNGTSVVTSGVASIDLTGKADVSSLATVATTGDYDDLTNKPTMPTVNNATLTIQKNGTTVETFTANASSNVTCNITVPTSAADVSAIPTSAKGANSGVCPLNASGKIDATYLPVYNGGVS